MKKITSYLLAALLSLGIVGSSLQTADAGKRERRIAAGVAIGLLGVAIIANQIDRKKRHRRARRHYQDDYYVPRRHRAHRRYNKRHHRHSRKQYRRNHSYHRKHRTHRRKIRRDYHCGYQIINGRKHEYCT